MKKRVKRQYPESVMKAVAIEALQDTKRDAEFVFQLLEFTRDWPRSAAASALAQASAQMRLLSLAPHVTTDQLIATLRDVAAETFSKLEAKHGIRPS